MSDKDVIPTKKKAPTIQISSNINLGFRHEFHKCTSGFFCGNNSDWRKDGLLDVSVQDNKFNGSAALSSTN